MDNHNHSNGMLTGNVNNNISSSGSNHVNNGSSSSSGNRQTKKSISLQRRVRDSNTMMSSNSNGVGGVSMNGGGGGSGSSSNGVVGDSTAGCGSISSNGSHGTNRIVRKKKKQPQQQQQQHRRRRARHSNRRLIYVCILGLVFTGTMVMSYVWISNSTGTSSSDRMLQHSTMEVNGRGDVTKHQQENFHQGGGEAVGVHGLLRRKFSNIGNVIGYDSKNNNDKQMKQYNRLELQKDLEEATSHLPPFPQEYMGSVPSDGYNIGRDYHPLGGSRFSEYTDGRVPYHITEPLIHQSNDLARVRRTYVKQAMQHAWNGYSQYAFGQDEILPNSKNGNNNWGGMAITMVDALDTLWLMGMKDEFYRGRDWVRDALNHDNVGTVSVFETTIRSLGGLLAAYDWSGDKAFLEKAYDLGKRLIQSFDHTTTGIPNGQVNLRSGHSSNLGWTGNNAILAEFGTIQVEFRYLAKAMHNQYQTDKFARKTERIFQILNQISPDNGLFPYYVINNPKHNKPFQRKHQQTPDVADADADDDQQPLTLPQFANNHLTFGAMADSLYEYMLKIWIQGGQTEPMYRQMYDKAIQGMYDELLQISTPSGLVYLADKNGDKLEHKMDHLVCFMGGLLALGAYTDPNGLQSDRAQRDLKTARALTYTCYQMYARMSTGISPEYVKFLPNNNQKDFIIGPGAPHYLLRPEAVESFFILNFLTNDPIYREWGWEVFQSIEKYCKTDIAYGSLGNVDITEGQTPNNKMESFFLAETLKYLYLLQDPDTEVDILNKHVFNTEAHPMRIFPVFEKETSW